MSTIYSSFSGRRSGEILINVSKLIRIKYNIIRFVGLTMTSTSMAVLIFSYAPSITPPVDNEIIGIKTPVIAPADETNSYFEIANETANIGINSYFSVYIPKIHARSNVVANVDPFDEDSYLPALKKGVAHAKGSYYPGSGFTTYLFSHSTDSPFNLTRYNAIFYELRNLEKGDDIIAFYKNKKYIYKVSAKHVVPADDISWLTPKNEDQIILQTCDPPGTTWRRLLVVADRV